jgi:benzylsuccinate CoA-transferase BbsF subunit
MRLTQLRVLDFCWVGAGAFVTRILADLGAEVIKVESNAHPDNLRLSGPYKAGAERLENSGYFASRNSSKKSFALNMTNVQARKLALRLASASSIVTNNFRPGVMDKWGLGYSEIASINPSVIYLSMPMQGARGPHSQFIGFGSTIAALCGLTSLGGFPGRAPIGTGTHYPDHIPNPGHALVALLAAIYHRDRTGEGQYIELAQIESTVNILGPLVLQCSATGESPQRCGNRRLDFVPCGVFPCTLPDTWCAIEVQTDSQWRGLRTALGEPSSLSGHDLLSLAGRMARQEYIEDALKKETRRYYAPVLADLLQRHDVAAAVVNTNADVISDSQLVERQYWQTVQHSEMGELVLNVPPFCAVGEERPTLRAPPLLGEHTYQIAQELLGIGPDDYDRLTKEGVFY